MRVECIPALWDFFKIIYVQPPSRYYRQRSYKETDKKHFKILTHPSAASCVMAVRLLTNIKWQKSFNNYWTH